MSIFIDLGNQEDSFGVIDRLQFSATILFFIGLYEHQAHLVDVVEATMHSLLFSRQCKKEEIGYIC